MISYVSGIIVYLGFITGRLFVLLRGDTGIRRYPQFAWDEAWVLFYPLCDGLDFIDDEDVLLGGGDAIGNARSFLFLYDLVQHQKKACYQTK